MATFAGTSEAIAGDQANRANVHEPINSVLAADPVTLVNLFPGTDSNDSFPVAIYRPSLPVRSEWLTGR
jgi:hypothetical protein